MPDMKAAYYKAGVLNQLPPYLPTRVRVLRRVSGDFPFQGVVVEPGEYTCTSNRWGAVCVKAINGEDLGLRLDEFDPLEWGLNPAFPHQ